MGSRKILKLTVVLLTYRVLSRQNDVAQKFVLLKVSQNFRKHQLTLGTQLMNTKRKLI